MRPDPIRSLLLALAFFSWALPARAADDLATVYAQLHAAMLAGNLDGMLRHASRSKRAEVSAMKGNKQAAQFMAALTPKTYAVTGAGVLPDGRTAELRATAMHALVGPPAPMYGMVKFVAEDGAWKVESVEWSSERPKAPALGLGPAPKPQVPVPEARPAPVERPVAKPTPPAPAIVKSKPSRSGPPCEFKPVMTDEEIERCR